MRVYRNDVVDWVIAESEEDAAKVWEESCGDDYSVDDLGKWEVAEDDEVITLLEDEGPVAKTCKEWAAEGRGFLGSTET